MSLLFLINQFFEGNRPAKLSRFPSEPSFFYEKSYCLLCKNKMMKGTLKLCGSVPFKKIDLNNEINNTKQ